MTERGAITITPSTKNQTIAANQFSTGIQTIKGDSNLVAGNVLNGKTIFGIAGNVRKYGVFTQDIATSGSKSFKDGQGTNSYFFWDSFNSRICHISSSTIWNIWCKMCWLLLIIIFELQ